MPRNIPRYAIFKGGFTRLFSYLSLPILGVGVGLPQGNFPIHLPDSRGRDFLAPSHTPLGQSCRLYAILLQSRVDFSTTRYITTVLKSSGPFCFSVILLVCETRTQRAGTFSLFCFHYLHK